MVEGRLRQGRVGHLAQIAQRQIGIALAQVAKDRQGVRKRVAQTPLFELIDQRKLMLPNIAVGVVDDGHAIVSRVSVPTMASRPAAEVVRDMGGAVEQVLARAGVSVADCRSMGVGSPGTCNSADGVVERAYNLGWDHVPVCRMLEQRFGIPCRLSNDANCAALAEQVAGAAVGHDNVVLVTLGTGVGGGIIIGGRIYDGMRGAGAELGHTLLVMDGEPCTCGRRGCWEAYSSATAQFSTTRMHKACQKPCFLRPFYAKKAPVQLLFAQAP